MVSGRAAAALGVRAVLAPRRQADLAQRRADRGREAAASAPLGRRRAAVHAKASRAGSASTPSTCCRPSRIRPSGCSRRARCRPTSIRPIPRSTIPIERARIMREFERHLVVPAGYVLPVQRWTAQARPRLGQRTLAAAPRRLFLVPGDSPIGFRLPLNSLPLCRAGRLAASGAGRSVRRARRVARSGRRRPSPSQRPTRQCAAPRAAGACRRGSARRARRSRAPASQHAGAHRAHGRAARRHALRVHAAGRAAGGLSRAARRGRGDRGASSACRCMSKAIRRRPIRASTSSR